MHDQEYLTVPRLTAVVRRGVPQINVSYIERWSLGCSRSSGQAYKLRAFVPAGTYDEAKMLAAGGNIYLLILHEDSAVLSLADWLTWKKVGIALLRCVKWVPPVQHSVHLGQCAATS